MSDLDDLTGARFHQILEAADSSDWSYVGRAIGERDSVTGRIEERARRIRGGWNDLFPELPYGPKDTAAAIRRGRGKRFRLTLKAVQEFVKPYVRRVRKKRPPSVAPHSPETGKCKLCHIPHSKKQHRFHGKGAFHRTHLWGFKMNKPRTPVTLIYGRVIAILAKKTQKHRCDRECRVKYKHVYEHPFKSRSAIYGLPAGAVILLPDGTRVKVPERGLLIAKALKV